MKNDSNENHGRCEFPFILLETTEFDMAADHDLSGVPVVKDYSLCTILHPTTEFDADESPWLALTRAYDAANPPAELERDVAALVRTLDHFDRSRGGQGLIVDGRRSSEAPAGLCVMLRPLAPRGAAERFRQLAEVLGCSLENGSALPPISGTATRLTAAVGRLLRGGEPQATDLDVVRKLLREGWKLHVGNAEQGA